MSTTFTPSPALLAIRAEIDAIDRQLAELLCQRLQLLGGMPRCPERTEATIQAVLPVAAAYGIDNNYLDLIFRLLTDETLRRNVPARQALSAVFVYPAEADALDRQLAELLCQRLLLIHRAAAEKPRARDIRLSGRIEEIMQKVLPVAADYGIDADYLDLIFRLLIDESIRREKRQWTQNRQSTPGLQENKMLTILIIGAGGREHALARKFAEDNRVRKIFVAPGNAGTARENKCQNINLTVVSSLLTFAQKEAVDLTIVGAEALLAAGIVDKFQAAGLQIFGPNQHAAQLESSKRFAKDFMHKYGVKTAAYRSFSDPEAARDYVKTLPCPVVVKASGLAAGKGVIICQDHAQALSAIENIMQERCFGAAGDEIVIEQFLTGFECSVLSFCDGRQIIPMQSAKDHKTIGEHNTGANTGGMGVIAPHPLFSPALAGAFERDILIPTLKGIQAEQMNFAGVIFFGLMINESGVYLLEYNMRPGDPETQAILPLLASPLLDAVNAALAGKLTPDIFRWHKAHTCCLVAASQGYPGKYQTGLPISGLDEAGHWAEIFIAGAQIKQGKNYTNGGRVLNVAGKAETLDLARQKAYAAMAQIYFSGITYRRDIGA